MSGNTFVDTEVRIDGEVTANVTGHSTKTIRAHGVRIDLFSNAKPAPQTVLGAKLDWKIKVDGGVRLHIKQGFGDHAVYRQHFTTGSGRHVVKVLKNNVVVRELRRPLLRHDAPAPEEPRPDWAGVLPYARESRTRRDPGAPVGKRVSFPVGAVAGFQRSRSDVMAASTCARLKRRRHRVLGASLARLPT